MKRVVEAAMLFLGLFIFESGDAAAFPGGAVAVSPGDPSGMAATDQVCPTFSWSYAEGAVSYRIEIYEQVTTDLLSHDAMGVMATPVGVREIAAPALSWTPSSGECLSRGM